MARKPTAWMPLYVADYLADTAHLTAAQSGAYLHLIMAYWRAGGPLRLSDDGLARTARMTPEEWAGDREVVLAFFACSEGMIRHGRIDRELAEADRLYRAQVARTAAATAARAARNVTSNVTSNVTNDVTSNVTFTQPQPQSQSPYPSDNEKGEGVPRIEGSGESRASRGDRGSRLPADWHPTEADEEFARQLGIDPMREADSFRDYWHGKPGAAGRKSDWTATWRNWVRRASERKPAYVGSHAKPRNGFLALAEARARADRDRATGGTVIDLVADEVRRG